MKGSRKYYIMHLIATNFYGGPDKQIIEHLKRLDSNRYCVAIVSFLDWKMPNETLEKAKSAGVRNFGIPMCGPVDLRAQWMLNGLLVRENVDLLCVHGYKSCVMGWWAGRKKVHIPVLAFSRGYTSENLKVVFYEWLERQAIKRVTGIVFVSEGQKRKLEAMGVNGVRSWVVHNAISLRSVDSDPKDELLKEVFGKLSIPISSKLVVTAGRLSPEKGHRYLIEAISNLKNTSHEAIFVFCGDGPCRSELEAQAKSIGVYEKCRFPGFRRDLQDIFQVMDLMVLPSLTEGLPNVVLEAFAAAKPVVATNVGGVPEIVEDGVNGYLVPPRSVDLLAKVIDMCLESPEMMKEMGMAGYKRVRSNFTFEYQTKKLEGIYREVLSGRYQ